MNGNLRGIFAIAILAAGCGAGGGDGGGAGGGTGGTGETPDVGVGGQGEGGQVVGGSGGAPVGGTVGGAGGEPVGGTVGGAGGEPVGGSGGAGGEPVGGAGGGIVPPEACAGALDLNAGDAGDGSFVAMGNTSGAEDLFTGSCANNPGLDAVFSFTAPAAGNWVFTTEVGPDVETFDTLLYARTDCADPATEVDCDDDDAASTQSAIVVPLEAGATAFIVVDGFNLDNNGDFWLTAVPQQSLAIGDACVYDDFRTACPENSLCYSPDGNDPTCTEVVTIELGGECEPFSAVGPCAEGLFCNDIENDGTFNCAEPVIVPEGGACQRFTPGIDCADGLICFDPDEDGTDTCVAPLAAAAGEPCQSFSDYFTCAEGLICGDPEFTGTDTCIEPLIVQEGSECEPFSEFIICAEPSTCLDALDDGNYTCVVVTTIDEGGDCTPGDAANVCIEGASCVDLDGDGTSNCTTPTPELAACPPAYGEVAVIDTAAAAPWTIDVDTSMGMHHTNGTCGNGGDANDVALSFTAPADGEYVAQMVGDFDTVLYAREYCGFADNLACNDDSEIGGSQIFLSLVAGQTIYLIADGYNDAASGMATISIEPAAVIQ